MQENSTQQMLLQNQLYLAQLQQANRQQLFLQNQQPFVQLQQNNGQPVLFPNQQPLVHIQQNNQLPQMIPGQSPLVNVPQTLPNQVIISNQMPVGQPQQNITQPTILQNQTPMIQPQQKNAQPPILPNQTPVVQPQQKIIQPPILQNQIPVGQLQQNNLQPGNIPNQQSLEKSNQNEKPNFENNLNNETNDNLSKKEKEFLQSMKNELKESEYAEIEYSRGLNYRKVFKHCYNCHSAETFEIYLGKGEYKKNSFKCTEISTCSQRYFVDPYNRQFSLDIFYNFSDDEVEFTKEPVLRIHRIDGGCCASNRGIITVNYAKSNELLGKIEQACIANIYDSNNQLLYRVKLTFDPESKNCFQRFCESFCCKKEETEEGKEERDYDSFLIKKLVEKEEVVEGEIVKSKEQIIVGRMKYYPLKIMFPENASTKEKILLIACRIFLLYMTNFAPTLRDLFIFDTCRNTIEDELKDGIKDTLKKPFGKIGDYGEKINDIRKAYNNVYETSTINKNISINKFFDD